MVVQCPFFRPILQPSLEGSSPSPARLRNHGKTLLSYDLRSSTIHSGLVHLRHTSSHGCRRPHQMAGHRRRIALKMPLLPTKPRGMVGRPPVNAETIGTYERRQHRQTRTRQLGEMSRSRGGEVEPRPRRPADGALSRFLRRSVSVGDKVERAQSADRPLP